MAFFITRLFQTEKRKFFRRAAAAKTWCQAAIAQKIRDRYLLGDIKRVMQIQTDDGAAEMDLFRASRKMERE